METFVTLLIPAILAVLAIRLLLMPLRLGFKIAIHCACGFVCLWLLNCVSGFTGIFFPVNAVTVLVSGVLGLPGIAILAVLAVL